MGEPNLRVLRKSRKKRAPGDVFVMSPRDSLYVFGRVVSVEAHWTVGGDLPPVNLIYVYEQTSTSPELPPPDAMRPGRLLIPPSLINNLPWSRGYFETLANVPLGAGDVLEIHCFQGDPGNSYDEFSRRLRGRHEPCGIWGLGSYRTVDDAVSEALNIPLAPD